MRHLLKPLMFGALLVSGQLYAQSSVANLVANPDFDTDTTGWTVQSGTPVFAPDVLNGDPAAPSMQVVTTGAAEIVSDCIAIPAPSAYWEFDINVRSNSGMQPGAKVLAYSNAICSGTPATVSNSSLAGNAAAGTWTTLSNSSLTLPSGTGSVRVDLTAGGALDANYDHILFGAHINQPPQLQYIVPGLIYPYGTGQVDTVTFLLYSSGSGGGSIGYNAADSDPGSSPNYMESSFIQLSGCSSSNCQLAFPGDVQGFVVSAGAGTYQITAPIVTISQILATMTMNIQGTSAAIGTVSITINDNGYSGWCSAIDSANCAKTGTAILAFDAYTYDASKPGNGRDRIFFNTFDPN